MHTAQRRSECTIPIYRRFGYVETALEDFNPSQKLKPGVPPCRSILMSKPL